MKKEYLNTKETEEKIKIAKTKYHKLDKIGDCFSYSFRSVSVILAIIMIVNVSFLKHVNIVYILSFLTSICAVLTSDKCIEKKKDKVREEYLNAKNQLEDIISIDFEKKRYTLEKKYSKASSNNDIIKNIQEEKELLEKYKQDLNQYCINRIDDKLNKEINTRNYTLQKLNQIK